MKHSVFAFLSGASFKVYYVSLMICSKKWNAVRFVFFVILVVLKWAENSGCARYSEDTSLL
jgi:hypothetical protein